MFSDSDAMLDLSACVRRVLLPTGHVLAESTISALRSRCRFHDLRSNDVLYHCEELDCAVMELESDAFDPVEPGTLPPILADCRLGEDGFSAIEGWEPVF
jgi:hypothetical protein